MNDKEVKLKRDFEKFKKESDARYLALLKEKNNIAEEMVKQQEQKELAVAKLESELVKTKQELIIKTFRFVPATETEKVTQETDECIVNIKCKGIVTIFLVECKL